MRQLGTKAEPRHTSLLLVLSIGLVAASLLIVKTIPAPFFWLGVVWAAGLFVAIFFVRGSWRRAILFNLGVVACFLAVAEAYFYAHDWPPQVITNGFVVPDDILGWAPTKGMQAHAVEGLGGLFRRPGRSLYDVTYTIDSDGLRIAPPWRRDSLDGPVLFFGDSFTFGYGLNDNEALPYQVGAQSDGRFQTFNFAFNSYSAAQMLARVEHGMVRRVVDTTPRYAFYIAIPDDVERVAGRNPWITHQPRYVLDADGTARAAGFFESRKPLALRLGLNKSGMWRFLFMREVPANDDDIRLYFAVVHSAQGLLIAQYANIQFRVILYPAGVVEAERPVYEKLRDGFRQRGIPVELVEDILPNFERDRSKYILSLRDPHPNALANRLLAQHILSEILRRQ